MSPLRILWLGAGLLLPLDKGGKLRTWHLMKGLSGRHAIEFVSFVEPGEPEAHVRGMREVAETVHTVPRRPRPAKGSAAFALEAAAHVLRRRPYAVGSYRSVAYAERVRGLLASGRFDLVVCDFLPPVVNLPPSLPCPAVLFTHNVEAEIWRRHAETAPAGPRRWLLASQHRRMARFEREAVRRFDLVLAVSGADAATLDRLYGPLARPVHVVPTGVDTAYFAPRTAVVRPRHLVFTGSMDWLPNEEGVQHFVRDVLPLVRRAEPSTTLSIVGRAPTPAVQRLADEYGVQVTGRVDDVRPYMAEAAVYVVPLRIGGGTRLKIFEAMAMGKAIVSTTIGAEGLPVDPGLHLAIADDAPSFARAVIHLLQNQTERARLGDAARHLVMERYDWAAVAGHLETALAAAARRRAASAPDDGATTGELGWHPGETR
jgi:sugar transferase (PEP-CTERM/EpsH1 system associated)